MGYVSGFFNTSPVSFVSIEKQHNQNVKMTFFGEVCTS